MSQIDSMLSAFDETLIEDGRALNTRTAYKSDILQFVEIAGAPDGWTTSAVEAYKDNMLDNRAAVSTINRKILAIRRFINFLNEHGHSIPAKFRAVKYQSQEFLLEVMSKEDVERIVKIAMEKSDHRAWALFAGLQKTGCRISELLQWRVGDIGQSRIQVVGKGRKVRKLLVPTNLTPILQLYAGDRNNEKEPLFLNPKTGRAYTRQRMDQIIKRYATLARVKRDRAHAHSLRHQHGQRLKEMGMTSEDIAALDGHTSTKTTDIYTRSTERELLARIEKL